MLERELEALRVSREAFNNNFDKLVEFLPGMFVAFIGENLVFFHEDLGVLCRNIYSSYKQRPIFIHKVKAPIAISLPILFEESFEGFAGGETGEFVAGDGN